MTDSIPPADIPANPQPPPQPRVIEVTAEVVNVAPGARVYEMPPSSPASASASPGNFGGTSGAASAPPPSSVPPIPPSAPPITPAFAPQPRGHGWAIWCHLAGLADLAFSYLFLGLIATLVVWLLKKDEDPEVDWHGKESLNFQISLLLWNLLAGVLICCLIGIPMLFALWLAKLVLMIYAAVRAGNGERWRYPLTLRLIT